VAKFRQSVHLVEEFEPLLVQTSQFLNEFGAKVGVSRFCQLTDYRSRAVIERNVSLQSTIEGFFVPSACHDSAPSQLKRLPAFPLEGFPAS
jgi:hypothetical protein